MWTRTNYINGWIDKLKLNSDIYACGDKNVTINNIRNAEN